MELAFDGPCRFGCEHLYRTAYDGGEDRDGEEHDAQSADPLGERTPVEKSFRKPFWIVDDCGTSRRKTRHGLKEGIREAVDISADHKRECAEQREENPGHSHDEVSVTATQEIVGIAPQQTEQETCADSNEDAPDEGHDIDTLVPQ